MNFSERLDKFFRISERNSTVAAEVRGGAVTFLSMAYIMVVMPSILGDAGMEPGRVFTGTVLAAIVSTLLMAFYANFPIALAPAMGTNAFFTYTIVLTMGYTWQEALGAVFLSGVLFFLISVSGIRNRIVDAIPRDMRLAMGAGIGAFLAFVGLQGSGIIVGSASTLVQLGDMSSVPVLLALFGICFTLVLYVRKVSGAVFIGVVVTAVLAALLGVTDIPDRIVSVPEAPYWGAFIEGLTTMHIDIMLVAVVLSFLMVDMFDTTGTLLSVAREAGAMDENGKIENGSRLFNSDAVGTMVGAALGVSTVSSYAESLTGIESGSRTGLSSLVVALLFAVALFFSPLFTVVTETATVAALVVVSILMMSSLKELNWSDPAASIGAIVTIMMMILTYSITNGLGFGIIVYSVCKLFGGNYREVSPVMYVLSVVFMVYFVASAIAL